VDTFRLGDDSRDDSQRSEPDGPLTSIGTLEACDAAHPTNVMPNNVLIQGITAANDLTDANTFATCGPQGANFAARS
jgi:hypothetical protein